MNAARTIAAVLLVLCLLSGCATVPVVRVIDGDTLVVHWRGMDEHVRLVGIDAPERGKPGAAEATEALREMVDGQRVRLAFPDPKRPTRGKYGRLIADVVVNGQSVTQELLRRGLVTEYEP